MEKHYIFICIYLHYLYSCFSAVGFIFVLSTQTRLALSF